MTRSGCDASARSPFWVVEEMLSQYPMGNYQGGRECPLLLTPRRPTPSKVWFIRPLPYPCVERFLLVRSQPQAFYMAQKLISLLGLELYSLGAKSRLSPLQMLTLGLLSPPHSNAAFRADPTC